MSSSSSTPGHRAFRAPVGARRHNRRDGRPGLALSRHVSSALIAFGFIAQSELRLAPFAAAVLPALFILGELTFVALLQDSFQNIEFLRRIQKIRGYHRGLVPEAEEFFDPPGRDRETASEMATVGLGGGCGAAVHRRQHHRAVNSILAGAGLALLLTHTIRLDNASITAVGVFAAALLLVLHIAYEHWRGRDGGQLSQGSAPAKQS